MADIADPALIPQPSLGGSGMVNPRRAVRPVEAASEMFGQLTDFYLAIEEQQAAHRRKVALGRNLALTTEKLGEKMMELADDAEPETRTDRFTEYGESLVRSIADQIDDEEIRDLYEIEAGDLVTSRRLSVFQKARRQEFDNEKNDLVDSLRIYQQDALRAERDGNELDRERNVDMALQSIQDARFPDELERGNMQRIFLSNYDKERVLAYVDDGDFDGARALLGDPDQLQSLEPDERISLRNTVDTEEQQAQAAAREASGKALEEDLFFLKRDIRRAAIVDADPAEIESLRERAMDWWRSGGNVGTAIAMDDEIDQLAAQKRKGLRSAMVVETAIENGVSLGKNFQDDVDRYYEKVWEPEHADLPLGEMLDAQTDLIGAIDTVPKGITRTIQMFAISDDPQSVALGAEMYGRFKNASPQADFGLTREEDLFLTHVKRGVDMNMDPARVLERERDILRADPKVVEDRLKRYRQELEGTTVGGALFGLTTSNIDWLRSQDAIVEIQRLGAWDPTVHEIPTEFYAPFSAEVERWIAAGATVEEARNKALGQAALVWGATAADGVGRVDYMPPEKMLPEWNGDSEHLRRDLERHVLMANPQYTTEMVHNHVRFKADLDTARELPHPGYSTYFVDDNGEFVSQAFNYDGSPFRWHPEYWDSPETKERERKRKIANEIAEADAKAVDAYLKGEGPIDAIQSRQTQLRAASYRALQIGVPLIFDTDKANANVRQMLEHRQRKAREDQQRAIQEWRDLGNGLREIGVRGAERYTEEAIAERVGRSRTRAALRSESLKRRTEADIRARRAAYRRFSRYAGESLRAARPPRIEEPKYTERWLGEVSPEAAGQ